MAQKNVTRKLAAILAADVVGYSRLIEADEVGTLARLKSHREALIDCTLKCIIRGLDDDHHNEMRQSSRTSWLISSR